MTIDEIQARFAKNGYLADRDLATVLHLSLVLSRPLLLEGEAGVGKTEVARVLARSLDVPLIRLQCYEGLDVNSAVYEWDYPRQMLAIRMLEAKGKAAGADTRSIFTEEFLIRRPLLAALSSEGEKGLPPSSRVDSEIPSTSSIESASWPPNSIRS